MQPISCPKAALAQYRQTALASHLQAGGNDSHAFLSEYRDLLVESFSQDNRAGADLDGRPGRVELRQFAKDGKERVLTADFRDEQGPTVSLITSEPVGDAKAILTTRYAPCKDGGLEVDKRSVIHLGDGEVECDARAWKLLGRVVGEQIAQDTFAQAQKLAFPDPNTPLAAAASVNQAPLGEVRPEVAAALLDLEHGNIVGVMHTTRGPQKAVPFEPQPPQPFKAGRFVVHYQAPDGTQRGLIMQTEARVSHLASVLPGHTDIGGHVSLLSDANDTQSETQPFSQAEQDALLRALYAKKGTVMVPGETTATQQALNFSAAIRFSGMGVEAVEARHLQLK